MMVVALGCQGWLLVFKSLHTLGAAVIVYFLQSITHLIPIHIRGLSLTLNPATPEGIGLVGLAIARHPIHSCSPS